MKSKQIIKLLVGIIVIGGGISYFMFQAILSSSSYYFSVDDFLQKNEDVANHSLRIAGIVKEGSIARNIELMQMSFDLAGSTAEMPITYKGAVPDNFTDGVEVVVEGRLDTDGVFRADTLMTRCESKYKAKIK
jgi:cytochrome c-type biogenesis protein CcmE